MTVNSHFTSRFVLVCEVCSQSLVAEPVRVPHRWCSFYFSSIDFLPTMFHTASIWLTVCLAVQRYISVSRFQPSTSAAAGAARHRQSGTILLIVCVYTVAVLSQICRFFEFRFMRILTRVHHDDVINIKRN